VRYHIARVPEVAAQDWKLRVAGDGLDKPMELTLARLKSEFEAVEVNALCICSGNRRGLSNPHVPGVQWGHGAMGNARWKGARLKDVLARAGIRKDAVEIVFDGADSAALDKTPDFVKSIPTWKAMEEHALLAYEMNGEPLPHWNGYPVRVVVPGWTATYWVKQLVSIDAVTQPFKGFWMAAAYRIPKGKFPVVDRFLTQETEANTPITEMVVSSLITNLQSGQRFAAGQTVEVKGVAWDGGYGIVSVDVSQDAGHSWRPAELGPDLGRFSWRQWRHVIPAARSGAYAIMAKATNRIGATQTFELNFNPAGYHNNVVQRIDIQVG
jgi:DMSO/TMAO reductase YedYZ molybdopterin-dependent catalytic subunit